MKTLKYFTMQQVAEISGKSLWVDASDVEKATKGEIKKLSYFTARQVCEIGRTDIKWIDLKDVSALTLTLN